MENNTQICKKCGKELELNMFKLTRWGEWSKVCNNCVTEARLQTIARRKEAQKDAQEKQMDESRKLRLADFSPRELMQELARRGYEGTLRFTEIHEINIKDF